MSRIVVCLDCPMYRKGGYCRHKKKDVSALSEACEHATKTDLTFNPENKEEMNTTEPVKTVEEPSAPTKVCICCGEIKPITEFYKDKKATDGHQSYCKRCSAVKAAERARKGLAEKRAKQQQKPADNPEKKAVARETLTDEQMVMALRARGWEVTCRRTITQEL